MFCEYFAEVTIATEVQLCDFNVRKTLNCLLNSSTVDIGQSDERISLPVGQFIPVDKQCQLAYGSSSFYCSVCSPVLCHLEPVFRFRHLLFKINHFLPRVPIMGTVTKGFDARLANYLQFLVFDFWELWYSSARVPESQKLKTVG